MTRPELAAWNRYLEAEGRKGQWVLSKFIKPLIAPYLEGEPVPVDPPKAGA